MMGRHDLTENVNYKYDMGNYVVDLCYSPYALQQATLYFEIIRNWKYYSIELPFRITRYLLFIIYFIPYLHNWNALRGNTMDVRKRFHESHK